MSGVKLHAALDGDALCERFGCRWRSRASTIEVARIAEPNADARERDLVIVGAARALVPSAAVALCTPELAPRWPSERCLVHPQPTWVMAMLLAEAESTASPEPARIAASAVVHASAVVYPGATVGEQARVEAGAVIYGGAWLGREVRVGAGCVIGRPGFGFVPGPSGELVRMPQLGGVVLEADVELGPLCTVDAGTLAATRIGRGSKLDAHVHVGHNVRLGEHCLVAAQVGFAGSVELGNGVQVGGQAGFKDHVRVGDGARIAAQSGVIGDIPPGAVVAGFPAVDKTRFMRAMARVLRHVRSQ
ncbi:MAG: UDP-3-O-(3-hydroxymyristoyl)glucosamine N-acyltransferase [Polyangiaceae bacterium]